MDKKVYKRLNTNYKNFKKESTLKIDLSAIVSKPPKLAPGKKPEDRWGSLRELLINKGHIKDAPMTKPVTIEKPMVTHLKKALSKSEMVSVEDYIRNEYIAINKYLRTDELSAGYSKTELDSYLSHIDSAIAKSTVKKDITVYRGMFDYPNLEDVGYMSTSIDKDIADGFGQYLLKINVPKDSKVLDIDDLFGKDEREFLLPRGSKFKKISEQDNVIEVELV